MRHALGSDPGVRSREGGCPSVLNANRTSEDFPAMSSSALEVEASTYRRTIRPKNRCRTYPSARLLGGAFRNYHHTVSRWKPSRPVLVAWVVLHIIVTAITLRDLGQRSDAQLRGPRWFWRVFARYKLETRRSTGWSKPQRLIRTPASSSIQLIK